jgi:thymidylate synthase
MNNPQYKPICRANELIVGTGRAIIITGWTPKERVAKLLEPHEYACIGNLYSPMYGLTPLIVNLLANPHNWDVYVLSATRQDEIAGASRCFYDLINVTSSLRETFTKESNYYKPKSQVNGRVDLVVPEESLRTTLNNLTYFTLFSNLDTLVKDLREHNKVRHYLFIEGSDPFKQYAEPVMVEVPKPESPTLPGDLSGHLVKGQTVAEVWLKAIHLIRSTGRLTASQYGERQELIQMTSVVAAEPADFHFEPWLPVTPDFMEGYLPYMVTGEISEGVSYNYGSKIRAFKWYEGIKDEIITTDQIAEVANKLIANPDSSQCTISLWNVATDTNSKNPPCLTNIWVRLIDKRLIMIATFRSHDMYTAYPSNVMALRRLQDVLLKYLDDSYIAGELIINSQSAHIYGHSFQHTEIQSVTS